MSLVSGLVSKFTVTPLLYAIGVLVLLNIGTGALAWKRGIDVESATAKLRVAQQDADTANRHVAELGAANKAWEKTANDAIRVLDKMRQDATDLGIANANAIAAAEAAQVAIEKRVGTFAGKFNTESRKPDCAHALAAMQSACPNLEGY